MVSYVCCHIVLVLPHSVVYNLRVSNEIWGIHLRVSPEIWEFPLSVIIRPTQSIMYIPFQVNIFQKSILLIVQYKYVKSFSEDSILKNPTEIWSSAQDHAVLHLSLNMVGFFISARQKSAWWKWFVPQLYQLRRGISEGPALKYFCMIHRGGRITETLQFHVSSYNSWNLRVSLKCRHIRETPQLHVSSYNWDFPLNVVI